VHDVFADVPLANMFNYVNVMRSLSQGRAAFTMRFCRYAPLPRAQEAKIVAQCA
jgi:elongation factor G